MLSFPTLHLGGDGYKFLQKIETLQRPHRVIITVFSVLTQDWNPSRPPPLPTQLWMRLQDLALSSVKVKAMQVNSEHWSCLEQRQTSLFTSAMGPRRKNC